MRIESAGPDTLDFVPQWYGERVLEHAGQNGARISMRGVTAPHAMDGLDKSLLGKDMLPSVKETFKVVSERSTNWCFVPAPHPAWARLKPHLAATHGNGFGLFGAVCRVMRFATGCHRLQPRGSIKAPYFVATLGDTAHFAG